MEVTFASGRKSARAQAEIVEVFKEIRATGALTPERVRDHARNPKSPLHKYFEWNDQRASDQYRLWQARDLIASVRIRIKADPEDRPKTIRAFVRVVTKSGPDYVETLDALSHADHRAQIVAQALAELRSFEQKYRDLSELAEIFTALAKVRTKLGKKKVRGRARRGAGAVGAEASP